MRQFVRLFLVTLICGIAPASSFATPANRVALAKHYGRFLVRTLDNCTTCHVGPSPTVLPTSLAAFPHNAYGARLRAVADAMRKAGKKADIPARSAEIANEDSDGDGVKNEAELLLGFRPGNAKSKPKAADLATLAERATDFKRYLASYRWLPFESVKRPALPAVKVAAAGANPVDLFLEAARRRQFLAARPAATRTTLIRRVYVDLIGLVPTPAEIAAFEADRSPNAYEKVVDRLLANPRYGERWGRHWMDVWRYSDWAGWTDGGQVRDSKPFIWRWRDWIVESLNSDKGYDGMLQEMLAADELAPGDEAAARATGFLVRNYKMLSREQWLEDTVGHTGKAFLGITTHCAKCHDHMYDPLAQTDYYRFRAIFEPHNVRTDRVPGQLDTAKDGLVLAYDADPKAATYLFPRGDERNPDKTKAIEPGVPGAFGGAFDIKEVSLTRLAYQPDKRQYVIRDLIAASSAAITEARTALDKLPKDKPSRVETEKLRLANASYAALLNVLEAERLEDADKKGSDEWKAAATEANRRQRQAAVYQSNLTLWGAEIAATAAEKVKGEAKDEAAKTKAATDAAAATKALDAAKTAATDAAKSAGAAPSDAYKPREVAAYPATSTGRRLGFARWLTDKQNPLAARVAVNHIWARHFGAGLVPSLGDFGRNGQQPTHPELLDWLASELMARNWQMKPIHRLLVTSAAYRMSSTASKAELAKDPDNRYLWRMSSRRMEAEAVRDNILYTAGSLDETMGGPEIDHNLGLVSKRRSIYLRIAAEKETEFLKQFDSPSVTECYERKPSVMPQQALALANSQLTLDQSKLLAQKLDLDCCMTPKEFVAAAFKQVLGRMPTAREAKLSEEFLAKASVPAAGTKTVSADAPATSLDRAKQSLVLVLFNHNDFVTVR